MRDEVRAALHSGIGDLDLAAVARVGAKPGVDPFDLGTAQEVRWDSKHPFPILSPTALHGLAGEFARKLAPHTEADSAAILIHFLLTFGCAVGPGPHVLVESTQHSARLNALVVGETARGRKGTAKDRVHGLFRQADDAWLSRAIVSGLSSGEGLINHLKDRDDGEAVEKRLLVVEPEFGRVLAAASRDSSILSAVIRDSWDSGRLQNVTKEKPLRATGCHISIIGDITADELRLKLSSNEIANGFLNRFLIIAARRSKKLPHGGSLTEAQLAPIAGRVNRALELARGLGRVYRTEDADRWWGRWYDEVPDEPGLLGAVTARAEAHVLRLSLCYALLDNTPAIDVVHLEAAKAVWDYAHASAQYVFGESLGDPKAQRLLDAARDEYPGGLDGTQQDQATGGRHTAAIRDLLVRQGLLRIVKVPGAGRPAVMVFAVPPTFADKADLTDKVDAQQLDPHDPLNPQRLENNGRPSEEVRI